MFKSLKVFMVLSMAVLVAGQAAGQIPGANDPDARELAAYKLTLPVLKQVVTATRNLATAAKNDPRFKRQAALKAEIKKLEDKEEMTEADDERVEKLRDELDKLDDSIMPSANANQTLAQMDAAMRKEPAFAKAIADAGLTPREYVKFLFAYMTAGMVAGMMESGVIKDVPKELQASINMENIKFIQTHKKELEAFTKELEAMEPK